MVTVPSVLEGFTGMPVGCSALVATHVLDPVLFFCSVIPDFFRIVVPYGS